MLQLVHDLRPDGHVQGRDRFIQHNQARIGCQSPGNGDALALPAAELVRKQTRHVRLQPDQLQHVRHALLQGVAGESSVDLQGFGDDIAHPHAWTERAVGVLEDHLHLPTVAQQPLPLQGEDVLTVEPYGPCSGLFLQQDQFRSRRLATP